MATVAMARDSASEGGDALLAPPVARSGSSNIHREILKKYKIGETLGRYAAAHLHAHSGVACFCTSV